MPKLVSKISVFLLAPVMFGAICLSCLVKPLPVFAAVAASGASQMDKACAEYKDPSLTLMPDAVVSTTAPAMAMIANDGMVPFAKHGSGCRTAGDDVNVNAKTTASDQYHTVAAVMSSAPGSVCDLQYNNSSLDFFRTEPIKSDLITGCVIKLE